MNGWMEQMEVEWIDGLFFGGVEERERRGRVCGAKTGERSKTTSKEGRTSCGDGGESKAVQSSREKECTKQRKQTEGGRTDGQPSLGCIGMGD